MDVQLPAIVQAALEDGHAEVRAEAALDGSLGEPHLAARLLASR